ncbi:methionyl-tRNA formyltransferase [Marinibactrum halimedae]|uniref:Methionyl-tRNA formyltransferase n=1 Tax=Marinibactrum halimedae TaxID=1444977 RepID=A0AA37T6E4_9GAMM|nr:methionyl-tRNA formyltransferase [Marinibactrum halimedae]MCD9460906.1 methionyl-tRNA formyltransferase [Marinibactrum halimedae]GLS24581.1 methionyl-tRNA formyltransferase [Marinibactrum halimedae]
MTTSALRIVFAGTPDFAAHHLNAVIESDHEVVGVYTQPDRPAGRGKKLTASPVKTVALEHNLPVYQPVSLRNEAAQAELASLNADVMVVVAYGLILPQVVLDTPKHGCINVHASILPRWRGAAPIQRAIEAGDTESGVTIMQMDKGLDTGDMLLKATCTIEPTDTGGSLHDKLADIGTPALLTVLDAIASGTIASGTLSPEKQNDDLANYASKISKAEAAVDWSQPAEVIDQKIRGFFPFPICHCVLTDEKGNEKSMRIHAATVGQLENNASALPGEVLEANNNGITVACGTSEGAASQTITLTKLQLPGKKAMEVKDVLNGYSHLFTPGTQLK